MYGWKYRRSRSKRWKIVFIVRWRREGRSRLVSSPDSPSIKRHYYQKTIPYTRYKTRVIRTEKNSISAMPRPIRRISIWKCNPIHEPHVQRYSLLSAQFFFLTSFVGFRIFSDRWIGLITKKKNGPTVNESISAWTKPCKKIYEVFNWQFWRHDQSKLPFKHRLGWPSSYQVTIHVWYNMYPTDTVKQYRCSCLCTLICDTSGLPSGAYIECLRPLGWT